MGVLPSLLLIVALGVWFLAAYSWPTINKYRNWFLGLIALPLLAWNCYATLHSLNASRDTRLISKQIDSIRDEVQKMPADADRPAEFTRRLKAIDPGDAPADVKRALSEYVTAWDQASAAWSIHRDTPTLEQNCAQKAKALTDEIHKNQ